MCCFLFGKFSKILKTKSCEKSQSDEFFTVQMLLSSPEVTQSQVEEKRLFIHVSKEGADDQLCVSQQSSCKTIGFILKNFCTGPKIHLSVKIQHHEFFTHEEPCAPTFQNYSYQCSLALHGENKTTKSRLAFCLCEEDFMSSNCSIVGQFLMSEDTTPRDNSSFKLKLQNLVVSSLVASVEGSPFLFAENVEFIGFGFYVDALSVFPCLFTCISCSFTNSLNENVADNVRMISLLNCVHLNFTMETVSMSSQGIHLSFMHFCQVFLQDLNFKGTTQAEQPHLFLLEQREVLLSSEPADKENAITIRNVTLRNLRIEGSIFQIYLLPAPNPKSLVVFENCVSFQSSGFLDYHVLPDDESLGNTSASHQLVIVDTSIIGCTKNKGNLMNLFNKAGGMVVINGCTFSHNVLKDSGGHILSFVVSRTVVSFADTLFANNTASCFSMSARLVPSKKCMQLLGTGSRTSRVPHIDSLRTVDKDVQIRNCNFTNNRGISVMVSAEGGGRSSISVHFGIVIEDILYENNSASSAGGIQIELDSSVPKDLKKIQEVEVMIIGCSFLNSGSVGAVWVTSCCQHCKQLLLWKRRWTSWGSNFCVSHG